MGRFTDGIGDRMRSWQEGRNGVDELCRFVVIAAVVLLVITLVFPKIPLLVISLALFAYGYFRAYSTDFSARRSENEKYLNLREKLLRRGGRQEAGKRQYIKEQKRKYGSTHRFFTCGQCGHELMVPKGKGKIRVTCPHCGNRFEAKS